MLISFYLKKKKRLQLYWRRAEVQTQSLIAPLKCSDLLSEPARRTRHFKFKATPTTARSAPSLALEGVSAKKTVGVESHHDDANLSAQNSRTLTHSQATGQSRLSFPPHDRSAGSLININTAAESYGWSSLLNVWGIVGVFPPPVQHWVTALILSGSEVSAAGVTP